jgi:hypothetical protein
MYLAALRDVDDQIALDTGRARKAMPIGEPAAVGVTLLGSADFREIGGGGGNTVFGELALHDQHLAAATDGAAAADGVNIDA